MGEKGNVWAQAQAASAARPAQRREMALENGKTPGLVRRCRPGTQRGGVWAEDAAVAKLVVSSGGLLLLWCCSGSCVCFDRIAGDSDGSGLGESSWGETREEAQE
jgi:hypothetical protein